MRNGPRRACMPSLVPQLKPIRMKAATSSSYYRGSEWFAIRKAVLLRDEYKCAVCGLIVMDMPQVDHIIPRRAGGSDDPSNLQTLCMTHHSQKTARENAGGR